MCSILRPLLRISITCVPKVVVSFTWFLPTTAVVMDFISFLRNYFIDCIPKKMVESTIVRLVDMKTGEYNEIEPSSNADFIQEYLSHHPSYIHARTRKNNQLSSGLSVQQFEYTQRWDIN